MTSENGLQSGRSGFFVCLPGSKMASRSLAGPHRATSATARVSGGFESTSRDWRGRPSPAFRSPVSLGNSLTPLQKHGQIHHKEVFQAPEFTSCFLYEPRNRGTNQAKQFGNWFGQCRIPVESRPGWAPIISMSGGRSLGVRVGCSAMHTVADLRP